MRSSKSTRVWKSISATLKAPSRDHALHDPAGQCMAVHGSAGATKTPMACYGNTFPKAQISAGTVSMS